MSVSEKKNVPGNIKVGQFRRLICRAEDLMHCQYHACVGEQELIYWFHACFSTLNELSKATCKTAKEIDLDDRERVFDVFSKRVDRNFAVWKKARDLYLKRENVTLDEVQQCTSALKGINNEIKSSEHLVRLYQAVLVRWCDKADSMTVRLWKRRLGEAEERYSNALRINQQLTAQASEILKRSAKHNVF